MWPLAALDNRFSLSPESPATWAALALVAGLVLFARGLLAYRRGLTVSGFGTSRIASVAVGEARLAGTIVAAESLLETPVDRHPCVYFRVRIVRRTADGREEVSEATRSTGFVLDDGSGQIRVFARDAHWDVPSGLPHPEPPGSIGRPLTDAERSAAAAALLEVHGPRAGSAAGADGGLFGEQIDMLRFAGLAPGVDVSPGAGGMEGATQDEAWLAPGDPVTILGTVLPYDQLDDADERDAALDDPVVAAEVAEARDAGLLAPSAEAAWGNAAIPGFGIGMPVRPPTLDPGVAVLEPRVAEPGAASAASAATSDAPTGNATSPGAAVLPALDPGTLVVAAGPGRSLSIFAGTPGEAVSRATSDFLLGGFGALLAVAAALALAVLATGGR